MSFAEFQKQITEQKVRTVEGALALLPESLRAHFALLFHSRSLHGSSYLAPRVIFYSDDGKFLVSFNGNRGQPGYNDIELAEFKSPKEGYDFREIEFSEKGIQSAKFSASNPAKCTRCHGDPARAVWDTFPFWPGAYAERFGAVLSAAEKTGFETFLAAQPTHPRYKYLSALNESFFRANGLDGDTRRYDGNAQLGPNWDLSLLLSQLNVQMIVEDVRKAPHFGAFSYALLGALNQDCGDPDLFIPESSYPNIEESFKKFVTMSDDVNRRQEERKAKRAVSTMRERPSLSLSGKSAGLIADRFRFIVEQGLGLSTGKWTMALEKDTFDMTSPHASLADMELTLVDSMSRDDALLKDLFVGRVSSDRYCHYLKKRSAAEISKLVDFKPGPLRGIAESLADRVAATGPQLALKCASCHESEIGPYIPFSKPASLAPLLKRGKYSHGSLMDEIVFRLSPDAGQNQMPLDAPLSDQDNGVLAEYFKTLESRR